MGFTQEALAAHLGVERSTVARWERGTMTPQPWNQPDLARALEVSRDALTELLGNDPAEFDAHSLIEQLNGPGWLSSRQPGVLEPPWSITGTLQVLRQVAGGPMDRRGFLVITGSALTGLAQRWGTAVAAISPALSHESRQGRLTPGLLDRLANRLDDLRRLDDALGGRDLHQLAGAEFRWLTRLAADATYDSATGTRLFSLITEAARLSGWLHFDAAHHAAAQSYYVAALRSSSSASDAVTGAHVLACMSFQAALTGHHQEAISLIDTAETQTRNVGPARLHALLATRKARAYAEAGDSTSCGRALNEAERRLDAARTASTEPDWLYFFDEAELAAQAAACWVDLHQPAKARPLIDGALRSMSHQYVRDRTIYYVRSAQAHLHAADLDPACGDLQTAAALARQTSSVRAVETIRSARRDMSRYNHEPLVKQLDRHLAELVA
jgi:hypothetical protein